MRQVFSIAVFLCLLSATLLFAQFETAEVLGTVRDPSGAVIARAAVTLTNQATGVQSKVVTGENGDFDFFKMCIRDSWGYGRPSAATSVPMRIRSRGAMPW